MLCVDCDALKKKTHNLSQFRFIGYALFLKQECQILLLKLENLQNKAFHYFNLKLKHGSLTFYRPNSQFFEEIN